MKRYFLASFIYFFLLPNPGYSQQFERTGMQPGGGRGTQEAMITGEVTRFNESVIVITTSEGLQKEVSFSREVSFIREIKIDRSGLSIGDNVLILGQRKEGNIIFPVMIRVLVSGGAEGQPDRGRRFNSPGSGAERPPDRGRRFQGPGREGDGPVFGTVSQLDPLYVDVRSDEKKEIEITRETRIFKEIPLSSSQIKPGSKVRVLAPPRPGIEKREAVKIILIEEDISAPSGRLLEGMNKRGKGDSDQTAVYGGDLLPDLPQQPIPSDFFYSIWLGRGLYSNNELDRAFKVARNLGVRHLKIEFKWDYIEPKNNDFIWNNSDKLNVEHIIKLARQYNIAIIPYFDTFMPWGEKRRLSPEKGECEGPPSRFGQYQAPIPAEYADYVFAVVDKLIKARVTVKFIELDNEISNLNDGHNSWNCFISMSAKQIKEAQNAAYDRVKTIYPDVRVSSTTFSIPGIDVAIQAERVKKDNERRNSFIKAYFEDDPRPKFDFLAVHEVLTGSGSPYTTMDKSGDTGYEFNFGSYYEAYDIWRIILDRYGYRDKPIINTESAAVRKGIQDAELLQKIVFARVNEKKNKVTGWILSQLTPSARFSEGRGEGISVGITRLSEGVGLKEGYYGFYTLMTTLIKYGNYEGRVMGELNNPRFVVEMFSDTKGRSLYIAFIPYHFYSAASQHVSLKVGKDKQVKIIKADATFSVRRTDEEGLLKLEIERRPIFVEVLD